jgi:hypothetical protein
MACEVFSYETSGSKIHGRAFLWELQFIEPGKETAACKELVKIPLLTDTPFLQNDNMIGPFDSGKPMGDDYNGAVVTQFIQCLLNQVFRYGIQVTGGFVEDKNFRPVRLITAYFFNELMIM